MVKQRYCFILGLVAFIAAGVLVGIVWSNMQHGHKEETENHVSKM